ncbi:MAG TPA: glycosyltransferase family 2 protein [Tepidisphaeraceae bacterium]|nr:glycosyltransferase family 2 protein [Tepidisphaeraceae bacterium]
MRISIITPSFNQRKYLEQTMRSVLGQRGPFDLTWHVIDGGSIDGTVSFLRSIDDPRVRWTSEPDRGQSHAINEGIDRSSDADVIGWLNSDDLYTDGALAAVADAFADPSVGWVVGRYEIIDADGLVIRSPIARYKDRFLNRYSYRKLLRENFIAQPAVFWRRDFGDAVGGLDESLHYTMDYDLWLRMGKHADPRILDRVFAQFRIHTGSKSGQVNREQFDEGYRVAQRYFGGDTMSQIAHRFNVEKIVWAYRLMRLIGR